MALLRKLFWVILFVISTLAFVVLFEHGTTDFQANLVKQLQEARAFVEKSISGTKEQP